MTSLYSLAANRWSGPILLATCSLALPLLLHQSNLAWGIAVLGSGLSIWGVVHPNRWLIGLPTAFVSSLLAFYLRTLGLPQASFAFLVVFGVGVSLILWLLPTQTRVDIILGYAGGIALLELFLVLIYWPINFPSRALLLTAGAFLLFELIERRTYHAPLSSLFGSFGIAAVAVVAIVLTAEWYSF